MAPNKARLSAIDRFTDASSSAITSGFSAAMQIGAQPKGLPDSFNTSSEGADWLRDLQLASGMEAGEESHDGVVGDYNTDEEDGDSEAGSPGGTKKVKKGRGKGGKNGKGIAFDSPAAQRKAQNRIAQREFRQRKQQYIRALEARVEVLSSDPAAQADRLRFALRGLLAENNQLRSMLGSLGGFIGFNNVGGHLQKAGMSREELFKLVLGSSEKTMTELWQDWPGARESKALRQLRLEANLPPEGLPESHQIPDRVVDPPAKDKSKISHLKKSSSSQGANGASQDGTEKRAGIKRKVDDEHSDVDASKRRSSAGLTETSLDQNELPASSFDVAQAQVSLSASGTDGDSSKNIENFYQDQSAKLFSLLSQSNVPGGQPLNSSSKLAFDIASPSQDPNALLASLFGVNSMRDYLSETGMTPSIQPYTNMNDSLATYFNTVNGRLKTIPGGEEPEEIRRLSSFASKIRTGQQNYGPAKTEEELSRALDGLSQLVLQMSNFRRQPSYQLPSLLEPTDVQQSRPHDPLIDALPFAGLRQRLIVQQDNLLIDNVLLSFLYHVVLHPGNVMEAANWEIKEGFLVAFPQLIDRDTLGIANSWRTSRGHNSLTFNDLAFRMS